MKKLLVMSVVVILMLCAAAVGAQFKLYPGASTDAWAANGLKEARAALPPGTETDLYVTSDSYDKVYAFYKGFAQETSARPGPRLPDGTQIRWSFFLLDNAKSMATSKLWLKVQRPSVVDAEMKDIRDVTSIQVVRKK